MADGSRGSSVGLALSSPGLVSSTSSDHSDGLMSPSQGLDQPKHKFNPSAASFIPGHNQQSIDDLLARIPKSRHSPSSKGKKQRHLRNGATPSPCVWVGNVSPSLSEHEFRAEFERYGAVNNIRMFPSSKCAFVTFAKAKYAVRALDLEGKQLGGMRLTLNPGTASRHLWVGNVGPDVTDSALLAAFSVYGPVESVRILRSNRCAFVNFIDDKDALAAAENMNGMQLGEMQLSINFQWPDHGKRGPRSGHHSNGSGPHHAHGPRGLDPRAQAQAQAQAQAHALHEDPRYGPGPHLAGPSISDLTASMHGLGLSMHVPLPVPVHEADPFATGHSPDPAPFAMQLQPPSGVGLAPYPLQQQAAQTVPSRQLFVGNLAGSISESVLWGLFSPFGDVEKVKYFPARGYAFVVFRNTQDAIWAREQMIKYPPFIAERVLVVNFGKPDDAEHKARDQSGRNPLEASGSHSSLNGSIGALLEPYPYDLSRRPSHAHSVLSAASAAAAAAAAVLHTPSASERGSPITHPRSPPPHDSLEHAVPHDPDHFGAVFLPPRPDHLHAPPTLHYAHPMVFHSEDRDHRIDAGFGMPLQFYDQGAPLGLAVPPRPLPMGNQRSYSAAVTHHQQL